VGGCQVLARLLSEDWMHHQGALLLLRVMHELQNSGMDQIDD
jgi:hypothetical protein